MPLSNLSQAIGKNLEQLRSRKGSTQSDMANKAGTNINYYAKLERGIAIPSLAMLEKLAKVLKVKSSDILPF